jgi:uncharacterized protein YjdB
LYNPQQGTCLTIVYVNCVGFVSLDLNPDSFATPVGSGMQLVATATYHDGTSGNDSYSAAWTSSNTSIATVQTTGAASPGLVSALAPGTPTIQASMRLHGSRNVRALLRREGLR